jgi:hypothetical protein
VTTLPPSHPDVSERLGGPSRVSSRVSEHNGYVTPARRSSQERTHLVKARRDGARPTQTNCPVLEHRDDDDSNWNGVESAGTSPPERKDVSSEPTRPTVQPTESAACGALGCRTTEPLFLVDTGPRQRVLCEQHAGDLLDRDRSRSAVPAPPRGGSGRRAGVPPHRKRGRGGGRLAAADRTEAAEAGARRKRGLAPDPEARAHPRPKGGDREAVREGQR